MLTEAVAVAATLTGLANSWPQAVHVATRADIRGVSSLTWLLATCGAINWLTIGIAERIPATIAFNSLSAVGIVTVLALLVRRRHLPWWQPVLTAVGVITLNLAAHRIWGTAGPSAIGVGVSVVTFIPQVIGVLRRSTAGVSLLSWVLTLATCALWSTYGLLVDEFVLVAPGLVTVPAAAVIVWRVAASRARRPVALTP